MPDPIDTPHLRLVTPCDSSEANETRLLAFPPPGPADTELEWFFTMAESDIGARSNFAISVEELCDDIDERAEAVHAERRILRWLAEVGDFDAGVLKAAYTARPWPLSLREELGRSTGVVVRLAAAEVGMPEDDGQLDALERRTADRLDEALGRSGPEALERLRAKARPLLGRAFFAYVRERGGTERPVLRGVS